MENRLEDFLAGLQCTFGRLARSEHELSRFLRSAENFYLDLMGATSATFPFARRASPGAQGSASEVGEAEAEAPLLPFWRYLVFYSTLALDQAGQSTTTSELQGYRDLATEISTCWPFLSVLISGQFHYPSIDDHFDSRPGAASNTLPGAVNFESTSTLSPKSSSSESAGLEEAVASTSTSRRISVDAAVQTEPEVVETEDLAASIPQQSTFDFAPTSNEPMIQPVRYSFTEPTPTPTPPFAYGRSSPDEHASDPFALNIPATSSTTHTDINSNHNNHPAKLDPAFAESPQSYSTRSTGRTLSESTQLTNSSTSTGCSDLPSTPPQSAGGQPNYFPVTPTPGKSSFVGQHHYHHHGNPVAALDSPSLRQSILMSRGSSFASAFNSGSGNDANKNSGTFGGASRSGTTTPTMPPGPSAERMTRLILADRGDNTARLVPTADGSYVLDVSIGGRKLLVHPERPAEIQYHNPQGSVVTQSLLSPSIPAQ